MEKRIARLEQMLKQSKCPSNNDYVQAKCRLQSDTRNSLLGRIPGYKGEIEPPREDSLIEADRKTEADHEAVNPVPKVYDIKERLEQKLSTIRKRIDVYNEEVVSVQPYGNISGGLKRQGN